MSCRGEAGTQVVIPGEGAPCTAFQGSGLLGRTVCPSADVIGLKLVVETETEPYKDGLPACFLSLDIGRRQIGSSGAGLLPRSSFLPLLVIWASDIP